MDALTLQKLQAYKKVKDSTHTLLDDLNKGLQEAEDALCSLALGVKGSVRLDEARILVFHKTEQGWKLLVEHEDQGGTYLLQKASKQVRILAAERFGALLDDMLEKVLAEHLEVTTALQNVRDFCEGVRT